MLKNAAITCGDFRKVMTFATTGDVLYCDPPYANGTDDAASFVGYTSGRFSNADQADLAALAWEAAERQATVIISNHDTPAIRDLYQGMELHAVEVRRSVAANVSKRGMASELIAVLPARTLTLHSPNKP
jgi:DNA adenine methylase